MPVTDQVRALPPYRALMAVDVKNFSGVRAADHHELTEKIPFVLARAFERAGFVSLWTERRFPAGRGDGFVAGFRPEALPVLVGPVVDGLQEELAYHHRMRSGGAPSIRMRMSIGVGPLTDSDDGRFADGSGAAMVETHRLLDSDPVRRLLENSDPNTTFVAVVISPRVFEDVVATGYATKSPSQFIPVPVHVKTHRGTAFLHVPTPSGNLLSQGLAAWRPAPAVPEPGAPGGVANNFCGLVGGHAAQTRDVAGGIHFGDGRAP